MLIFCSKHVAILLLTSKEVAVSTYNQIFQVMWTISFASEENFSAMTNNLL